MREVNEAWRVLGDADRRRAYDDDQRRASGRPISPSQAGRSRSSVPAVADDDDDDDLVEVAGDMGLVQAGLFRHGPWVALVVIFAVIFVVTAYATSSKEVDEPTGSQVGSCVDVAVGPSTTVVPCDGPHELRIVTRIPDGGRCPDGTEKRRLAVDGYLECVQAA